ncbi:hypothetical protein CA267_016575 [Alteromonas pelagimontana]|uniref:LURP-one-related family protein n=1 Tax=Alteromonas pelagimontana TaxID=1858656 RepID=A0A6M4MI29_9ALTE|nr:hypothetical protein [Alteromonas pelagimontana]QJR82250.1 hypothetical protein CA267_016575 [Alteromonas pelagimontana]
MSTVLSISNKLMSFRGRMSIGDENGEALYDANGQFSLFCRTWTLNKSGKQIATVKRKIWAWMPTYNMESFLGNFMIKRHLFSWTRAYSVIGGQYDGTEIRGNFWDLKFRVTRGNNCIASAKGKILTLRDTHSIQVHGDKTEDELFTSIVMVVLHLDRKSDRNDSD